jgi:hypothetical protein
MPGHSRVFGHATTSAETELVEHLGTSLIVALISLNEVISVYLMFSTADTSA